RALVPPTEVAFNRNRNRDAWGLAHPPAYRKQGIMSEGTVASRWNLDAIEDAHRRWKQDPTSVDESWRYFFEGFELGAVRPPASGVDPARLQTGVIRLIYA